MSDRQFHTTRSFPAFTRPRLLTAMLGIPGVFISGELHKVIGASFTVVIFSFAVFCAHHEHNASLKKDSCAVDISCKPEPSSPIVHRNSQGSGSLFTPSFKAAFTNWVDGRFIPVLPGIKLASVKALFINIYQHNIFYVFISINAP